MRTKTLLFYLLAALVGGCVPVFSLHPLHTDKDVILNDKLLGTWADVNSPETTWQFKRTEETERAYRLIFKDDEGNKGSFEAHLVKLEDRLFIDVFPDRLPCDPEDPNKVDWAYNSVFLVPVHTFMKVDSIEPMLKMRLTDDDAMEKFVEENPEAVKHAALEDQYVLTASTKELQAFVLKYADDEKVFANPVVLKRAKARTPQKPGEQKSDNSTH